VSPLLDLLNQAIQNRVFPGAAYAVGNESGTQFGYAGRQTYSPQSPAVDEDSLWDVASLTKVVATTPALMHLAGPRLDRKVADILPEFGPQGKQGVTIAHLLLHTSGLAPYVPCTDLCSRAELWSRVCALPLQSAPGIRAAYSCLGFVALRELIERLAGEPFENWLQDRLYTPLGMSQTRFNPSEEDRPRCVPTAALPDWQRDLEDARGFKRVQDEYVQGDVHDPIACVSGGVSGNAGVFSTVSDLARFARAALGFEESPIRPEILSAYTQRVVSDHGLGWTLKSTEGSSAGSLFSTQSFGHLGYTGTSLWIDPEHRVFAVLLTNRIHPDDRKGGIAAFRPRFHDAAFEALSR
jgi:CubicO group peptidase (beta-lactamase class C family)